MPQKQKTDELDLLLEKILLARAIERIASGQNRRAAALLRAIVLDFPENHKARDRLVQVCLTMARDHVRNNNVAQARGILEKALALDPGNQQVQALSGSLGHKRGDAMQQELTARIRQTAKSFVQRYYPDQSKWFDPAWRIFKGVTPEALNEQALTGALAAMGEEESGRVVAHMVVMLSTVAEGQPEDLTAERLAETIRRAGRRLGADEKLIDRLVRHVVDSLPAA